MRSYILISALTITIMAIMAMEGMMMVGQAQGAVKIQWLGHACFLFTGTDGKKILIDPFEKTASTEGYRLPEVEANIVLVTHQHKDHNYEAIVKGSPKVIKSSGEFTEAGIKIKGVSTFHDDEKGAKRGQNIIFIIEMEGMRLIHFGDLGHPLTDGEISALGKIDVAFMPVGGFYTLEPSKAFDVIKKVNPAILVPMHYRTKAAKSDSPLAPVENFLAGKDKVKKLNSDTFSISKNELPKTTELWIVEYKW